MTKELVIFIKETELSVFFKDGDKYTNQKIKGESFLKYSQLDESLEEIAAYLKQVLPCEDYSEYNIVLFVSLLQEINPDNITTIFQGGSIRYLALELVQAYQHVLKVEYGEKENNLEEELKKRTEEIVQLKQRIKGSNQQFKNLHEKRKQDQKTITQLGVKAKKFDENELLRKTATRMIVTVDKKIEETFGFYIPRAVELKHYNRARIKKGSILLFVYDNYENKNVQNSPMDGFLYWLGPNQAGKNTIDKFKLENDTQIVLAVISSSPNELDSDIIKFAKAELKK